MKYTFAFIGLALGYVIGHVMNSSQPKVDTVVKEVEKEVLVKKDCPTVNTDHSLDEAKKIYEKAFKIFLATIGHKLDSKNTVSFNKLIDDPKSYVNLASVGSTSTSGDENFSPLTNYKESKVDFSEIDIEGDNRLKTSVKNYTLKDPIVYFSKAKYVTKFDVIKKVNGRYVGKLFRISGKYKGKVEEVELEVDFLMDENKPKGSYSLKLIREGHIYSHNRGSGGNGNIKFVGKEILLDASPSSFIHFQSSNLDVGNYYDEGELVGVVRISKN